MIVVGVDPGFRNTGLSAFRLEGEKMTFIDSACVSSKKNKKDKRYVSVKDAEVIRAMVNWMVVFIQNVKADLVVVELPPGGGQSASASRSLGISTTVCALLDQLCGRPVIFVTPRDVKEAATGDKEAEKDAIIDAVTKRFPQISAHKKTKQEHVADSVGCVLAWKGGAKCQ